MKNAPAYIKIYNRLKNEIQKGTYPVGGFLPKEYELEEIYQVSRTTIRNAVKILAKEGMVEVRQGRGTRVLDHKAIQNYNKVMSVTEALRKKGYEVTTGDMLIDVIEAINRRQMNWKFRKAPGWQGFSGCSWRTESR